MCRKIIKSNCQKTIQLTHQKLRSHSWDSQENPQNMTIISWCSLILKIRMPLGKLIDPIAICRRVRILKIGNHRVLYLILWSLREYQIRKCSSQRKWHFLQLLQPLRITQSRSKSRATRCLLLSPLEVIISLSDPLLATFKTKCFSQLRLLTPNHTSPKEVTTRIRIPKDPHPRITCDQRSKRCAGFKTRASTQRSWNLELRLPIQPPTLEPSLPQPATLQI